MYTLQQKLRQLRGWQRKTLADVSRKAQQPIKDLAAIEVEGRRGPQDIIAPNAPLLMEWDEEAHRTLADTTIWRLLQKLAMQHNKEDA